MSRIRLAVLLAFSLLACMNRTAILAGEFDPGQEHHLLYVAAPGIRDDLTVGGAGILVFDIDRNHAFLKRIATPASDQKKPENIKGICADAATGRLYFTTLTRIYCLDLEQEKSIWEKALSGGCDRLEITADGRRLYVPSLEGPHRNVVDARNGDLLTRIETKSGAHNTICSLHGPRAYLAGLKSPWLTVIDTKTEQVIKKIGPFSAAIRPFTVNAAETRCYVNVNGLLGFETGDLTSGKMLERVEVQGFRAGPTKRHGCPSNGIGLTPDEREIWMCDAFNRRIHIFDLTVTPPKQFAGVPLREEPGWITFSLDGRFAYASTGEVIDVKTKKIAAAPQDEQGRQVHSEKLLEIDFRDRVPTRNGSQFGLGRAGQAEN
jgi:DNA-binding beta-propeller fold protein YncE